MLSRPACLVLGLGIGALLTTPLTTIVAAVICGEDWREVLSADW